MLSGEGMKIKHYLAKYQNAEATRKDVMNTMKDYKNLAYGLEPFVFNNGANMELFNLHGTIPVKYKGNIYNIPICIWLMDTHPNNAPICYVKPTADMNINVSMYVDHNGKIYLPYLHDWSPQTSDLLGLIQVMIVTFGEQPPVYTKRTDTSSNTPYPIQPYAMPMPPGGNVGSSSITYPPYPSSSSFQSGQHTGGYPPYPSQPPVYPFQAGVQYPYPNTQLSHYFPSMPVQQQQMSPPSTNTANNTSNTTGTISEEHIRASLLSAVEDKLRRRLQEHFSQTQAELETLGRTQQELTQGKNKLDDILARLEKEQVELDKNITILKDKEQELEKAVERLSEQQPIDVDEAVTTTAPLYKQLLTAFTEEAATEDAIYYMGEALRRGVIDLDVFLKQVRSLSRKQFMLRALMHKCRQKAGLAG